MIGSWRVKVLSGVSVLAIAGMSAAVSGAEQNKTQQTAVQGETLTEMTSTGAAEEIQLSNKDDTAGESASLDNIAIASETKEDKTGGISQESSTAEGASQESSTAEGASQESSTTEGAQENGTAEGAFQEDKKNSEKARGKKLAAVITEEDIDAYFDQTVFTGDSVMVGFRNYAMHRANTYLGRIQFLASGSFSVHNALWPVTNPKSVHPLYQGKKMPVWESVGIIKPKRIFLFFGLNDMNMGPIESTCACYSQVIENIKAASPDTEIHIISMTYTVRGKGKGNLTNTNIRVFNELLKQMARESGWGFVDLAPALADANGDLVPAYCSDNYVHQTNAAYDVWSVVLRDYARSQLDGSSEFFVGEKEPEYVEAAGFGENWPDTEKETEPSERKEIFGTSINP